MMRKSSKLTMLLQVTGFQRFSRGKREGRNTFRFRMVMRKGKVQLFTAMLLDARCRTLARRRAPRSWSQLACASAWTVLATCSLRTSSRLRRVNAARYQDMLRSYYDLWAKTFCGAELVPRTTRALLSEMIRETLSWPVLSPDLSPNDYAL